MLERLSADLTARVGRGYSVRNVWQMKAFYLAWRNPQMLSAESEDRRILQTMPAESVSTERVMRTLCSASG